MLTRRIILTALSLVLVACGGGGGGGSAGAQPQAQSNALPVYLIMGQSNAVGYSPKVEELPVAMQQAGDDLIWSGGRWIPLAPMAGYQTEGSFGAEVSFGASMPAVGVVKVAKGATSLAVDWAPGSALYARAVAEARAAAASRPVRFVAVLWVQGESDAFSAEWANAYAENLRTLVSNLRRDLDAPDLLFVVGRVNPSGPTYDANIGTVRAAIMAPGINNYTWLDLDSLTKAPDRLHYDTAGQVLIGQMFAEAVR